MPSEQHEHLCNKAHSWLRRNGFTVAATNITASGSRERVDCIGFRECCSALVEAKVSRSDFLADRKKPERIKGGVGVYRYYIAPAGLLRIDDLPDKWGLLELDGRTVKQVHGPIGNRWPDLKNAVGTEWESFASDHDRAAERSILFSIARRALNK